MEKISMPYVPLRYTPLCHQCKTTVSAVWRRIQSRVACNECYIKHKLKELAAAQGNGKGKDSRVSGRNSKKRKGKYNAGSAKGQATKGRNRRVIFQRNPTRSALFNATVIPGGSLFSEGVYYQVGDIVSLMDQDGCLYYAQIRGLLQDLFCEKSATITWLLPTQSSKPDSFDPSSYILGPEEDVPRSLEEMHFVCHAPHDYFKSTYSPYTVTSVAEDKDFIWTSLTKAESPTVKEIFGTKR
ncbi:GATAD1-like transcription factor [Apostichopus japonicus]|uniref:GATAD1-like transcription factor n=1 Tax=Stichopus japonicus TaxID=307972 RepID=A0A2G8LKJ6_STIJA|nr:GATAD1-like transcription factor [Apostichopus japonicus]